MKKRSRLEKYAHKSIRNENYQNKDGLIHILSPEEQVELNKIRYRSLFYASFAGALGVLMCYIPYHIWPNLFPDFIVEIPFINEYQVVPVIFLVFSLILVVVELMFLTYNNIQIVKKVSHSCGYPNPVDTEYEERIDQLVAVGLEKKPKNQSELGINPYFGMPKAYVFMITVFNLIKATLTNALMKLIVRRLLGRYALRVVVDLLGVPIYAFWNAWASNRVYKEARSRVLAPPNIKMFLDQLYLEQKENPDFIKEIYHILDFLAIKKRSFHDNHYLLSKFTLSKFSIQVDPNHSHDKGFIKRIKEGSELTRNGFSKLLLFGMLIEGNLSVKEKLTLKKLKTEGVYIYALKDSQLAAKSYYDGKGIELLLE